MEWILTAVVGKRRTLLYLAIGITGLTAGQSTVGADADSPWVPEHGLVEGDFVGPMVSAWGNYVIFGSASGAVDDSATVFALEHGRPELIDELHATEGSVSLNSRMHPYIGPAGAIIPIATADSNLFGLQVHENHRQLTENVQTIVFPLDLGGPFRVRSVASEPDLIVAAGVVSPHQNATVPGVDEARILVYVRDSSGEWGLGQVIADTLSETEYFGLRASLQDGLLNVVSFDHCWCAANAHLFRQQADGGFVPDGILRWQNPANSDDGLNHRVAVSDFGRVAVIGGVGHNGNLSEPGNIAYYRSNQDGVWVQNLIEPPSHTGRTPHGSTEFGRLIATNKEILATSDASGRIYTYLIANGASAAPGPVFRIDCEEVEWIADLAVDGDYIHVLAHCAGAHHMQWHWLNLGLANQDPDGDNLVDVLEFMLALDPLHADTDRDYIADGNEFYVHGTDPRRADSDSDGLTDFNELYQRCTSPLQVDSDGDGQGDGYETEHGSNPCDRRSIWTPAGALRSPAELPVGAPHW